MSDAIDYYACYDIVYGDYNQCSQILCLLVLKTRDKLPIDNTWWQYVDTPFGKECLLCGEIVIDSRVNINGESEDDVITLGTHGYNHLKERNLLPFI